MALFKELILMPPVEIASTCYTYEGINTYLITCVLEPYKTPLILILKPV